MRATWIAPLIVACGAPAPAPPAPPRPVASRPVPSAPPPLASAASNDAAAAVASPLELRAVDPAPPAEPPAIVEILTPFAEQSIPVAKGLGYRVRLKVQGWPPAAGGSVLVMLDQQSPRKLPVTAETTLGKLLAEDAELEPGEHLLVAVAVRPDGEAVRAAGKQRAPYAAVRFWIGERSTPRLDVQAPIVVVVSPRGTLNGPAAADAARVDYLILGAPDQPLSVEARVSGRGGSASARVTGSRPLVLQHLESGDWDVEVTLIGADGAPATAPQARATSTFTVNRDAEVAVPVAR